MENKPNSPFKSFLQRDKVKSGEVVYENVIFYSELK